MLEMCKSNPKLNKVLNMVFSLILLLYPLRHIRVGVEWWDTGYNYANFTYMDRMDPMWLFSTYLGNAVGHLFTKLPLGDTMIGLNLYTGLVVSVMALTCYWFFVKKTQVPGVIIFFGEMLAISLCWCPTALLYNYLTYLLLMVGSILLYQALMEEKRSRLFFVLAGICLGLNVFVRFSNLANMALIVAVWAMGIIRRERPCKVVQQTLWCVLGYVIGLGGGFGYLCLRYGADAYIQGILRLLAMPSEASSYTISSMVLHQLQNYLQNLIWLGWIAGFMVAGTMVYHIFPGKLTLIKNVGYVVCVFGGFYVLMCKFMFNMKYSTKMSMYQWAAMLLTATIIAGVIVIFRKSFTESEKLLCGMNILLIVVTPLGSNNHLYSSINNLFFVAPFTLWMLYRFWKWIPKEVVRKKITLFMYPVKAMLVCVFFMISLQSILFGWVYVFYEGNGGENLHTSIENNDILKGMLNDETRAEYISEISLYVSQADLKGREVILYGKIPAMSYYLEMPFAISAWPDLESYNYSVMESDLSRLQAEVDAQSRELPVILMEKTQGTYVVSGSAGLEALGTPENVAETLATDKKLQLLTDMIEKYGYTVAFENEKFVLFLAEEE